MNSTVIDTKKLKAFCEGMYYVYARRELVYPDPLWYLYGYDDPLDREVVGLIAASLAYGRVSQIMKSVERVLACLGSRPREFLLRTGDSEIVPSSFKHRFTTSEDMNNFLKNIGGILRKYDSVENFMGECLKASGGELFSSLDKFSDELSRNKREGSFSLMSAPRDGSPCKRLFLYLRWQVRTDEVDPGHWRVFSPSELLIPLDTHMLAISRTLGFTSSSVPSLNAAKLISNHFSSFSKTDPTKYDFPLTRFGIRSGLSKTFTSLS